MQLDTQVLTTPPRPRKTAGPTSHMGRAAEQLIDDYGPQLLAGDIVTMQSLNLAQRSNLRTALATRIAKAWPDMCLSMYQTDDNRLAILLVKKQGNA